jgi:transcriptional regulator with XRE-family HTH domain
MVHNLRRHRLSQGLSAHELAEMVGAGRTSIYQWECCTRTAPEAMVRKLAKALRTKTAILIAK